MGSTARDYEYQAPVLSQRNGSVTGTPAAEFNVTLELVRKLLASQFPQYAHRALQPLDSGFDNVLFRLGEDLLVRMPRRAVANDLIRNEQTWLPRLSSQLDIRVPQAIHRGVPEFGYPWSFSLLPWLPGTAADLAYPNVSEAPRFAQFLLDLHRIRSPNPALAPANAVRGVPLAERRGVVEERFARLQQEGVLKHSDFSHLEQLWRLALAQDTVKESVWLHGDLHARNVLVENGAIVAVIDWGDITSGDWATDVASLWMLFDDEKAIGLALHHLQADAALIARARGWAFSFATMLVDSGRVDNPRHEAMGYRTFKALASATHPDERQNQSNKTK